MSRSRASGASRWTAIPEAVYRHAAFPIVTRLTRAASWRVFGDLLASERTPRDVLRNRQNERLRALIRWAYDSVPAQRVRFDEAGLRPEDIRGIEDLARLPIQTKRDLQQGGTAFHSTRVAADRHWTFPTSGTTGEPLVAVRDVAQRPVGQGSYWHSLRWCGLHPADSTLDVSSRPRRRGLDWESLLRMAIGVRQVVVSPKPGTDPADHARLRAVLEDWQPRCITGAPRRLTELARAVLAGAVRPRRAPTAVIYYGAVITDDQRDVLARAFGAPIHSRYAAAEFVPPIAYTCEHGWFHVNVHHLHVEIVDGPRNARTGDPAREGRVVVTDLTNLAAPTIRYEVGDLADWGPAEPCPCGRTWPRFAQIRGRHAEVLITPSGREISSPTLFQFLYTRMPSFVDVVWEYQFRQYARDDIEICVVPRPAFTEAHAVTLRTTLESSVADKVRFRVTTVDQIPAGSADKRPLLVNLMAVHDFDGGRERAGASDR